MVAAVLFDLDGTLVASDEAWFLLMNAAARAFGCPPISRAGYRAAIGQGVEDDARRFFGGRPADEVARFYEAAFASHAGAVEVDPDAPALLAALRARGVRAAVITNSPTAIARAIVVGARLEPEVIVGATDVARPKPAPDMVHRACAGLGVAPARALVVGDSRFDREAAQAAGARFAGLRTPGDVTLSRLGEVLPLVGRLAGRG